ncbi:hypothetical protein LG634_29845 [Streptomyces bambusae]|uniref:HEAT repeat domain-containing protein n=1 Tax=Streptomyces bambusae TaxID=1550616 RepID=UPI001CFCD525|nr:HEAT repeat domain-containing protein [Streptomyces bambusae]MCB5169002.1 hypothetical protein [Streptomyces bambusae]
MSPVFRPSLSPAERLLLGIPPERALHVMDAVSWERLEWNVHYETDPGRGMREVRDREDRPDWSTAPRWVETARPPGVAWSALPPGPAEVALGLCHHDPRVRGAALGFAGALPGLLPLLFFRCADPQPAVRARAREVLAEAAAELTPEAADRLVPVALLAGLRRHGDWGWEFTVRTRGAVPAERILEQLGSTHRPLREGALRRAAQHALITPGQLADLAAGDPEVRVRRVALSVLLAAGPLPAALAETLITESPDDLIRHTALDAALAAGLLPPRRLARLACTGSDPRIRRRCLAAALAAVGPDDPADVLGVLGAASSAVARSSAVTALHGIGRGAEARAWLADPSARVRSAARLVVRMSGGDPAALYRELYERTAEDPAGPPPGLAFGLVECAPPDAVPLLRRLAAHPAGRVRAAALAALRIAGAVTPDELMHAMSDPHPPLVRAARKALVPYVLLLPEEWLAGLVAPGRPRHTRHAGLRLLSAHGLELRKRVLAPLSDDEDPEVRYEAQRARYEQHPGR